MNSGKTATTSQQTASGATPFDQITALEQQESTRVEKEISAMNTEKTESVASLQKKEEESDQKLKEEAKKELKEHSEKELGKILNEAKSDASKECDSLESKTEKLAPSVVSDLVKHAKDPDFLLAA